ncbi:MAG: DNA-3-methyladenine glycosylase, partial [Bradymonadaceae bacterium]
MTKTMTIKEQIEEGRWLDRSYFEQEIHGLARDLLGRALLRRIEGQWVGGSIVEVEVYLGGKDPASHARSGVPTERTWPMFGPAGLAYVYKIYGMYHCLNIAAPPEEGAGAILIRACEPLIGLEAMASGRNLVW